MPASADTRDSCQTAVRDFANPRELAWQSLILLCSIFTLLGIAATTFSPLPAPVASAILVADAGVCIIFLMDFIVQMRCSQNKWRYFVTWGWIDLVSSIPLLAEPYLWGRLARLIRIARLFRG
jgi:voltage-gated potassium channel